MKLKKVEQAETGYQSLAAERDGQWYLLEKIASKYQDKALEQVSRDLIAFLQYREGHRKQIDDYLLAASQEEVVGQDMKEILPFQPLSYRDFMLSERHVLDASKGMVKHCMSPAAYKLVTCYERLFKKPFPALVPKKPYYDYPIYYKGNHLSFQASGSTIEYPSYASLLDYELELGFVLTKEVRNCSPEEGVDAIGAFCVLNDCSARNVQIPEMKQTGFGPCKSKDFASSISNIVVTVDEILPIYQQLKATVKINGQEVAHGMTNEFLFSLGECVAHAARGETLYPGEFMATGTIPGCSGIENDSLLKRGDTIRLEIESIGFVENQIV